MSDSDITLHESISIISIKYEEHEKRLTKLENIAELTQYNINALMVNIAAQTEQIKTISRVVYGAAGTVLLAFLYALLRLVAEHYHLQIGRAG